MKSQTPEYVKKMTDAEYKAWVEKGEFPKRLEKIQASDKQKNPKNDRKDSTA